MEYQVILKAPYDMTEKDYTSGNILSEERNGISYGIWFPTLEEAKTACIQNDGYGIIDYEMFNYVWYNPEYKSKSFENLRKYLGKILLPH